MAADKNKLYLTQKDVNFSAECERLLKFPCKNSFVCGVAGSKFLCNKTKYLCIDIDNICNDVNDCFEGDNSDESRCKTLFWVAVAGVEPQTKALCQRVAHLCSCVQV